MRNTRCRIGRLAVVGAVLSALGGCAQLEEAELFDNKFWEASPAKDNTMAELGLAELAKGNYLEAEHRFQQALKKDSRDVYALTGLGILYQNTGQMVKAREMYEAVLAIRPDRDEQFVVWNSTQTRPIIEVASVNLALLDSGGLADKMAPGGPPIMAAPSAGGATIKSAPGAMAIMGRPLPQAAGTTPNGGGAMDAEPKTLSKADSNVVGRFETLANLREEGLITQQEYAQRRQANVGALLPLTAPPPASGLDRPVPSTDQISQRLRAIGRALEMRAMTVGQHASERTMILDALMPSAPVSVANPGMPPQGLMEAADAVHRLEQLRERGLITSDEYAKERAAVEGSMQPAAASGPETKPTGGEKAAKSSGITSGARPAIHLASYRSAQEAERGWLRLKRSQGALLEGLQSEVDRVDLGPGKGIYYRLKAGPVATRDAAKSLCSKLKANRLYCVPTFMGE